MPPTKSPQKSKVDAILRQFNSLGYQSKQLVFLILLGELRSQIPRSNPARKILDEFASLSPQNKSALKKHLGTRRRSQNAKAVKPSPKKKSATPARRKTPSRTTPKRKSGKNIPGAVNLSKAPPRWYYAPHYNNGARHSAW